MDLQKRLREKFHYQDGDLIHKKKESGVRLGRRAGYRIGRYLYTHLDGKQIATHRCVWIYHNGAIPDGFVVDHIDRNKLNNRIENLRLATLAENGRNRDPHPASKSGVLGVTEHKKYPGRWRATIAIGTYDTIEEAIAARKRAEQLLWGSP